MPEIFYRLPALLAGSITVLLFVAISLGGMVIARR